MLEIDVPRLTPFRQVVETNFEIKFFAAVSANASREKVVLLSANGAAEWWPFSLLVDCSQTWLSLIIKILQLWPSPVSPRSVKKMMCILSRRNDEDEE